MGQTRRSLELNIALDERKIASAEAEVKALDKSVDSLTDSEIKLIVASKRVASALDGLADPQVARAINAQSKALDASVDSLRDYSTAADRAIAKQAELAKGGRGGLLSEGNAQAQGDISTSLGGAASVVGNIPGLGGAGSALAGAGDIAGFLEYIPRLNEALLTTGAITPQAVKALAALNANVVTAASTLLSGGGLSAALAGFSTSSTGLVSSIQAAIIAQGGLGGAIKAAGVSAVQAIPGIAGAAVSFGAVALAVAPVVLAVAGAAIAIKQFTDALNEQKKGLQTAYDAQVEYQTLIRTSSKEEIDAKLFELEVEKEARQAALDGLNARIDAIIAEQGVLGQLSVQALGLNKLRDEEAQRIEELNTNINALSQAAKDTTVASEDAGNSIQDNLNKSLKDLSKQAQDTSKEVAKVFEEVEPFIAKMAGGFSRADLMGTVQRASEARTKIAEMGEKLAEDQLKVQTDTAKKIKETETKALEDRAKLVKDSTERIADIQRDSNRRLEDIEYSRQSAIFARDDIALKEAQRAKEIELEDRRLAINEERESYQESLSELKKSAQERIALLQQEEAERIAALRATYEEQKALESEFLSFRAKLLQDQIAGRAGGGMGGGASVGRIPQMDTGGFIREPGLASLHKGEIVLNAERSRDYVRGGNRSVSISPVFNISGAGNAQETADAVMEKMKNMPQWIASEWAKEM